MWSSELRSLNARPKQEQSMKAILRRLHRIEQCFAPRPTEQDRRMAELAELIRERRRWRLEAEGLPFEEPPPLPPTNNGRPWTLRDILIRGHTGAVGKQSETA